MYTIVMDTRATFNNGQLWSYIEVEGTANNNILKLNLLTKTCQTSWHFHDNTFFLRYFPKDNFEANIKI